MEDLWWDLSEDGGRRTDGRIGSNERDGNKFGGRQELNVGGALKEGMGCGGMNLRG